MSIVGIGVDQVELERIAHSVERYGDHFFRRCFTDQELTYCRRSANMTPSLAARFAAKEAAVKALGTGIAGGVRLLDVEVTRQEGRAPVLTLHGQALAAAGRLGVTRCHLSLTHTHTNATAFVVLESE